MKIYYTERKEGIDGELEQVCPFGEKHHHKRNDGSEYTTPKYVGSLGCFKCPYCYGAGFTGYLGLPSLKNIMFIPVKFGEYDECEHLDKQTGLKQYRCISKSDYVKCSLLFSDNYRNRKKTKFKIWWWHKFGLKIDHFAYKLDKLRLDVLYKINRKIENIKFNRNEKSL